MIDPQITTDLVRDLIADQFPHWADLPVAPVAASGWDNRTFHLGTQMSVRLPSAATYAAQVDKEQTWLPKLAPYLPLPIPKPLAKGRPSDAYPFDWSVMAWRPGVHPARPTERLASDLAAFLHALQHAPVTGGPGPGQHNFHRGGDLRIYDQEVRHCLDQLGSAVDQKTILRLWAKACHSNWTQAPVWLHGDVAVGNLLVQDNSLSAVIDFGCCAMGDPACDLTIAWTFLDQPTRAVFRDALNLDNDTWARARGWCLWKALLLMTTGDAAGKNTISALLTDNTQDQLIDRNA